MIQPKAESILFWMKTTVSAISWSTLYLITRAQTAKKVKKVIESLDIACNLKNVIADLAAKL